MDRFPLADLIGSLLEQAISPASNRTDVATKIACFMESLPGMGSLLYIQASAAPSMTIPVFGAF
jgi:hypothetical protein